MSTYIVYVLCLYTYPVPKAMPERDAPPGPPEGPGAHRFGGSGGGPLGCGRPTQGPAHGFRPHLFGMCDIILHIQHI